MRYQRPTTALRRGFTLVELLAAVAIVAILAALAIMGYQRYVRSAGSSEASAVISGIRTGEEAYKAETLSYLNCSSSLTDYYPMAVPGVGKSAWVNPGHADYLNWKMLNVVTDGPVRFGYAVVAGPPGATIPNPPGITGFAGWPAGENDNPWYVIQAAGDRDGNGVFAIFVGSSLTGEIFKQNDYE